MVQPQCFLRGLWCSFQFRDAGSHPLLGHLSGSSGVCAGQRCPPAGLVSCPQALPLIQAPRYHQGNESGCPSSLRSHRGCASAFVPGLEKLLLSHTPELLQRVKSPGKDGGPSPPRAAHPGSSSPCSDAASWPLLCLPSGVAEVASSALSTSAPGPRVVFWGGRGAARPRAAAFSPTAGCGVCDQHRLRAALLPEAGAEPAVCGVSCWWGWKRRCRC